MNETNQMTLTDDSGAEHVVDILLTFDSPEGKHYVLFMDPAQPDSGVYAYSYDEDGNMEAVTDEDELSMCEEVLGAFEKDGDDSDVRES